MKMNVNEKMKRALSILLCLCMLMQNAPLMAFAAEGDNLCEHHSEHTAECGYVEGQGYCAYHCDVCLEHDHGDEVTEETTEPAPVCVCGDSYVKDYTKPQGHAFTDEWDESCNICGEAQEIVTTPMYRLYNPNTGEHFYTGSTEERDNLVELGWNYEGIAWNAPVYFGDPVYRFFNPNTGDHHYTMDLDECAKVRGAGWVYEGVAWNSAPDTGVPIYRLYNPNAETGIHHYTSSVEERDWLVGLGWKDEGIGWYGLLK